MSVLDFASGLALLAGGVFCAIGAVGLLRLPDFYTRAHGASLVDTAGAGLILFGLILKAGFSLVALKLVIVGLLIFFTSPAATHALAKAALHRGVQPLLGSGPWKR